MPPWTKTWGLRDVTSESTVPEAARAKGVFVAKQELVVAGLDIAVAAFRALDPAVDWAPEAKDGDRFFPGTVLGSRHGQGPRACSPPNGWP